MLPCQNRNLMTYRRKKRTILKDQRQDEAEDLVELLLEQAVPSTPEAWFRSAWKDGKNAIVLGTNIGYKLCNEAPASESIDVVDDVLEFADTCFSMTKVDAYWTAQELKTRCEVEVETFKYVPVAVLNMIQKWASHSDGGGVLYNVHLQKLCEEFLMTGGEIATIEPLVCRWRARDAIGIAIADLDGDHEPKDSLLQKRLRAFEQAWNRGLYKVAYCI